METPSSMRRVTRSQTAAASKKHKKEDAPSSSRNGERMALLDITNDSPIVGLATGSMIEKTPSSWVVKSRVGAKRTPGSGEALLRGQVKALLQKVEEEAELVNNHPSGHPTASFGALLGLPYYSAHLLLAPTPANTPCIPIMSGLKDDVVPNDAKMPCSIGDATIPQQVVASLKQEGCLDLQECLINRALLFDDSPAKSAISDASTMSSSPTCQVSESGNPEKSPEDDISSLQVGSGIEEDDGEDIIEDERETYNEEAEEDDEEEEFFNNLCEDLSKMSVQDVMRLPECTGKHTRFIYNCNDEMEGEEEVADEKVVAPNVLVLRGLPAPEGKHMRFLKEEEDCRGTHGSRLWKLLS